MVFRSEYSRGALLTLTFEWITGKHPDAYSEGQLRTLQRRMKRWRAEEGPPKEVFFPQAHRPGEAMQTDFTNANELGITINGEVFEHLLSHHVLPYSNWQYVTVCRSESMMAMKRGVQDAIFSLGRIPEFHQTDNSTAATHRIANSDRGFNDDYQALMNHLDMTPRCTGVGKKEQNGDVEAANGALKSRLKQHLLLRGSTDFDSVAIYEAWIQQVLVKANHLRRERVADELAVMQQVRVARLPAFKEIEVPVSYASTIRVKENTYSVPSRLVRARVKVRIYDDRIEVRYRGTLQLSCERLLGRGSARIDYRHIIWSLVRKPGAFERYKFREELFPTLTFRRAYDALLEAKSQWQASLGYLRILHLAASTMECDVEVALQLLMEAGEVPEPESVKELVGKDEATQVPNLKVPTIDLREYDALLVAVQEVGS